MMTPELFLIPLAPGRSIAYSPLTRRACRVDTRRPVAPQIAGARLIGDGLPVARPETPGNGEFLPDQVTLFPTNRCGLRCGYCYAQGGLLAPLDMPLATARTAIDFVSRSARARGRSVWTLAFHGGGEPLFATAWIETVVAYARERSTRDGLRVSVVSSTGGLLRRDRLPWLARNFDSLGISFEVLPEIQDEQRPAVAGRPSWDHIDAVLRDLDALGGHYGIRTTVTQANLRRLPECAERIARRYRTRLWHVEPMAAAGSQAQDGSAFFVDLGEFADRFLEAHDRCRDLGLKLQYSGAMLEEMGTTFHCGVAADHFAVTPDGLVTSCHEVVSGVHPYTATFVYGRVTAEGQVEIDETRRRRLHELDVRSIPWCRDCFLKYHCAGDCVLRVYPNFLGDRDNPRCSANRRIGAGLLDRALAGAEGPPTRPGAAPRPVHLQARPPTRRLVP